MMETRAKAAAAVLDIVAAPFASSSVYTTAAITTIHGWFTVTTSTTINTTGTTTCDPTVPLTHFVVASCSTY